MDVNDMLNDLIAYVDYQYLLNLVDKDIEELYNSLLGGENESR